MLNFGKVVEAQLWGVTSQNSDLRMPMGNSTGGTFTGKVNPLRGTLVWDECAYVLTGVSVNGGATGGSYTVTIETDAIAGYTALPIARATLGPNSVAPVIMDNLHQSQGSPLPTHLNIDQTASGAASFQCHVLAKQYRGVLGTAGNKTSERILQGSLVSIATISADTTFILGTTDMDLGMGRMRLWDKAFFWGIAGSTITGTWDVDIVGRIGGQTTSIASTGVAGALTTQGHKIALANNFYGLAFNPTQVIVTEVSAGTMQIADVVGVAKSGRGSLAKS